jgi:hypothetical protein
MTGFKYLQEYTLTPTQIDEQQQEIFLFSQDNTAPRPDKGQE